VSDNLIESEDDVVRTLKDLVDSWGWEVKKVHGAIRFFPPRRGLSVPEALDAYRDRLWILGMADYEDPSPAPALEYKMNPKKRQGWCRLDDAMLLRVIEAGEYEQPRPPGAAELRKRLEQALFW